MTLGAIEGNDKNSHVKARPKPKPDAALTFLEGIQMMEEHGSRDDGRSVPDLELL